MMTYTDVGLRSPVSYRYLATHRDTFPLLAPEVRSGELSIYSCFLSFFLEYSGFSFPACISEGFKSQNR